MIKVSHTINRNGNKVVNRFKSEANDLAVKPIYNKNIWMHSIERHDTAGIAYGLMSFAVVGVITLIGLIVILNLV